MYCFKMDLVLPQSVHYLFWAQKGLNDSKSCMVGQGVTIPDWWGPLGAILGHLGVGPVWSLFLTHLAAQNDLNCPKSGKVGKGI